MFCNLCSIICLLVAGKESNIPLCIFKKDSIPEQFIEQHLKCCSFFYKLQSETIESNLQLFQSMTEESIVERDKMREYCVEVFVDKYNIRRIPGYFRVVSYMNKVIGYCVSKKLMNIKWYHSTVKHWLLVWRKVIEIGNVLVFGI